MMSSVMDKLTELDGFLEKAKGIAWDTCHKIYIMMDDQEVEKMRGYEYDPLITSDEMGVGEMLRTVLGWYNDSCGLRFIEATRTGDNETLFYSIVPQFFDDEEEEDDE